MYNRLNNKMIVPVVDRYGYHVDDREITNAPLPELWPDEKAVFIQWTAGNDKPEAADLRNPIVYQGVTYYGAYAWGSAVKRGQTIGLTRDFVYEEGPVKMVEDGQRVQRWLFNAGIFGGLKANELTIGIRPPHKIKDDGTVWYSMTAAGPVEDGFGYMRRSVYEKFCRDQVISLGTMRDNWTFWQRIPWELVQEEMMPIILDDMEEASRPEKMMRSAPHSYEQKKKLVDITRDMYDHPFVANALNRNAQSYFARLCSSVNLHGDYRLCVPTTVPTICWPGHSGKIILDRSPIDSNGSLQAVEVETDPAEEERLSKMMVVQYTIASRQIMLKGCLGVVDDDLLDYDIVVCSEDIKMVTSGVGDNALGTLTSVRNRQELTLSDVVIPFLAAWDSASLVGINAAWAKYLMGLDHDGDAIRLAEANELPKLWQAIHDLPAGKTPKLPKTHRKISEADLRAEMIIKSMANLVGMATNVAGGTFMTTDRDFLAAQLGFKTVESMDARLNYFIKVGTDGFKTDVDQDAVAKECAIIQNSMRRMYGHTAPWTGWDGHTWAFSRGIPPIILAIIKQDETMVVYDDLDGNECVWQGAAANHTRYIVFGESEPRQLGDNEKQCGIYPFMTGTIAQIARVAIRFLDPHWSQTIAIRPLTAFRTWAPEYPDMKEDAEEVQFWFNTRVGRVNWTDPKDIAEFKLAYQERLNHWQGDKWDKACALWHVAHSSRGAEATAASVFLGFPDECERIVRERPGGKVKEVTLTGLGYQLPRFTAGELRGIRVEDVETMKGAKKIIRRAICGQVQGQVAPRDPSYPRDLIAFVAANTDQPEVGIYEVLKIQPFGQASWKGMLA